MTAHEVAGYITSTFPDDKVAQAMGATFFSTDQLLADDDGHHR